MINSYVFTLGYIKSLEKTRKMENTYIQVTRESPEVRLFVLKKNGILCGPQQCYEDLYYRETSPIKPHYL